MRRFPLDDSRLLELWDLSLIQGISLTTQAPEHAVELSHLERRLYKSNRLEIESQIGKYQLTLDFSLAECTRSGTSSRNRCINRRRQYGKSFRRQPCSADHRAKITRNSLNKTSSRISTNQLTLISFEFLSSVANGKSGCSSFCWVSSTTGAECFSNAFAKPLSFFSSACSAGSFSFFSIFSQNPRLTTAVFTEDARRAKPWMLFAQIRSIWFAFDRFSHDFLENIFNFVDKLNSPQIQSRKIQIFIDRYDKIQLVMSLAWRGCDAFGSFNYFC